MSMTSHEDIPVQYALRLADLDDLPHIVQFFKNPNRPWTVFERTEKAFGDAINNGLMWLLTDASGDILATAAVHILPAEATIGSRLIGSALLARLEPMSLSVNFAEIGSVWRPGDSPAGFLLDLVYSACILQTYRRAHDLLISALVTQIVAENEEGIEKLLLLQQGWAASIFHSAHSTPFKATIADPKSREIELSSFSTPVGTAILSAAQCLLGLNDKPKFSLVPRCPEVIQAYDVVSGRHVQINLRGTELVPTAHTIINGFDSNEPDNRFKALLTNKKIAWRDAATSLLTPTFAPAPRASKIPHPAAATADKGLRAATA